MNAPLGFASYVVVPPAGLFIREDSPRSYGPTGSTGSTSSERDDDPAEVTAWTDVHRRLLALGTERAALEREVSQWLLAAERLDVARRCGMASLFEYADRHLGLSRRQTEERLRVAKALGPSTQPSLPHLDRALASGQLPFSKVRELSRVVTPDTEAEWVDWAAERGCRAIEAAVASRQPGELPTDAGDPSRVKHRLSFEVKAETLALFRDVQARIKEDLGEDLDDDALLLELARRALGGGVSEADEGRAPYQVAVTRCDSCERASIDAGGQSHAIDSAVADMAECDAQQLGRVDRPDDRPHVGAAKRATQTIPPAIRRQVMRRDRKRCRIPGCQNHRFLDIHHIRPRSEGGDHDPEQLAVLCGAHHRAVHQGSLVLGGTATEGFTVHHADGSPYGARLREPEAVDVATLVFQALVNLGFRQTEARARIRRVQSRGAPAEVEGFLRQALREG